MRARIFSVLIIAFSLFSISTVKAQCPAVTVRFANPEYDYATQIYSVDVEYQCDMANQQLFGMNVRFFYPENILEFIAFGEFEPGYGPMNPNPPIKSTGNESSGMTLFGFAGPQEYINGAIQKTGTTSLILSTTGWTKVYNVSFQVDDTGSFDIESFCPPLIWDLNEGANGGIAAGIIITVVNGSGSAPATEHCVQFNWQYDGIPGYPHGNPVAIDCISTTDPDSLPVNDTLQGIVVPGGASECYDALEIIYVAGDETTFIVQNGAEVNLIAGQKIFLMPGTFVQSGAEMLASITTTENFCSSYQSSVVSNPVPGENVTFEPFLDGQAVKVFPNQTDGRFTVLLDENQENDYQLCVSGLMGNTIIQQRLEGSDRFEFDLSDQNPGIYIIRILAGNECDAYKLIKQ